METWGLHRPANTGKRRWQRQPQGPGQAQSLSQQIASAVACDMETSTTCTNCNKQLLNSMQIGSWLRVIDLKLQQIGPSSNLPIIIRIPCPRV